MGLADDLLSQAEHLATYPGPYHTQASLRRAVSTAYYSLFHLLIDDAAGRWHGSPEAQTAVERGFKHGIMKSVSQDSEKGAWRDRHGDLRHIPSELRRVAREFRHPQEERHAADYDNHRQWSKTGVLKIAKLLGK